MNSEIIQIIAAAVILLGAVGFAKKIFTILCKKLKSIQFRMDFTSKNELD
jgi:hypothetical protein